MPGPPLGRRRRLRPGRRASPDRAIVATVRTLAAEGLVVGTVGNVSVRTGDALRITPTRTAYAALRPRDLVTVAVRTGASRGAGQASRELPLHLAVYRARPDVGAIIHTHSVHATAWSFLGEPLAPPANGATGATGGSGATGPPRLEDLDYYGIDAVVTAPYGPPGSAELGDGAAEHLADGSAVLLGRHGVLTVGATLDDALDVARVVERQAHTAWLLRRA